jgi:hypothetical protein
VISPSGAPFSAENDSNKNFGPECHWAMNVVGSPLGTVVRTSDGALIAGAGILDWLVRGVARLEALTA